MKLTPFDAAKELSNMEARLEYLKVVVSRNAEHPNADELRIAMEIIKKSEEMELKLKKEKNIFGKIIEKLFKKNSNTRYSQNVGIGGIHGS